MRIAVFIFLSIAAAGFTPAHACDIDVACEPQWWDGIDNLKECKKRKKYCMGINRCWRDQGAGWMAYDYRDRVILPGYERCVERNSE